MIDCDQNIKDILVSPDEEEKYCQRNGLHLRRLNNGATVLTASRLVEDMKWGELEIFFPSGAYNDPVGKSGAHHLLEHLIMVGKIFPIADAANVLKNAGTNQRSITVMLEGSASPDSNDFGLWPVIQATKDVLAEPLGHHLNLEKAVEREKRVVLGEISEDEAKKLQHDGIQERLITLDLFGENHPFMINVLGLKEEMVSITPKELIDLSHRVFVPKNMVASGFTSGDRLLAASLANLLEDSFNNFPRAGQQPNPDSFPLSQLTNPTLAPGQSFFYETGLGNKLVSAGFVWLFDIPNNSREQMVLFSLQSLISQNFFNLFRQEGWGYTASTSFRSLKDKTFYNFSFEVGKRLDIAQFLCLVHQRSMETVLRDVSEDAIEDCYKKEKRFQEIEPVPRVAFFNHAVEGLRNFGHMIDYEKMLEMRKSVTIKDYRRCLERFLDQEPIVVAIGDLG